MWCEIKLQSCSREKLLKHVGKYILKQDKLKFLPHMTWKKILWPSKIWSWDLCFTSPICSTNWSNELESDSVELKPYRWWNHCSFPSDLLAQLVEHQTSKPKVPGSNPGWSLDFVTVIHVMCGRSLNLSCYKFVAFILFLDCPSRKSMHCVRGWGGLCGGVRVCVLII